MRKILSLFLIASLFVSTFAVANEVNVFNARHYKADAELYSKFTSMTRIKVNLINGKSGALEKRIIEEGVDSSADLYITADAGRCGAMDAKGMLQGGLISKAISTVVPKNFYGETAAAQATASSQLSCSVAMMVRWWRDPSRT